ncbi:transposable element Tcb2 transposase [Caerostris darwini]|uniref:Transposable element Tcb2 transposase n=1 Tax=Caerostris darwini TaxID=1538125 RepID=A0AAV4X979_9ARAC|nr:transposable element Tcb2 transposase [Caerostris darwini]
MNDNARPQRDDDDYLDSEGIALVKWLADSPDFNHIENLWVALDYALRKFFLTPAILTELQAAIQENCRLLDSEVVDHLMKSMVTLCEFWCSY